MFSEVKNVNVDSPKNAQNCWIFGGTSRIRDKETKSQKDKERKRQREEERKDRFFEPLMFMNLIH